MLEKIDPRKKLSKKEYKKRKPVLQRRLLALQRACWENQLASIVVLEGWSGAGKGTIIKQLTERLEPRAFKVHATRAPRTLETRLPWMWRFWERIPNWGEMAIFDRSWYRRVQGERIEGLTPPDRWREACGHINFFERTLSDDRYCITKFFLHIDKKTQKARFKKLESDALTSWRVQKKDWKQLKEYDEYQRAIEQSLALTETEWAPWTIVGAWDHRWAVIRVLETLNSRIMASLQEIGVEVPSEDEDSHHLDSTASA